MPSAEAPVRARTNGCWSLPERALAIQTHHARLRLRQGAPYCDSTPRCAQGHWTYGSTPHASPPVPRRGQGPRRRRTRSRRFGRLRVLGDRRLPLAREPRLRSPAPHLPKRRAAVSGARWRDGARAPGAAGGPCARSWRRRSMRSRRPSMRSREAQRSRVYAWQNTVPGMSPWAESMSLDEVRPFAPVARVWPVPSRRIARPRRRRMLDRPSLSAPRP